MSTNSFISLIFSELFNIYSQPECPNSWLSWKCSRFHPSLSHHKRQWEGKHSQPWTRLGQENIGCNSILKGWSPHLQKPSIHHGVGRSIIRENQPIITIRTALFWLKSACLYHFFAATQKDFALYLYLCRKLAAFGNLKTSFHCAHLHNFCTRIRQIKSKNIKILYGNEFKYAHNITIIRSELSTLWAE